VRQRITGMIEDALLDLVADCYVALRARGYLLEYPTFEAFLRRTVGMPPRSSTPEDVLHAVVMWPPEDISVN
jgi:hypothetical protein